MAVKSYDVKIDGEPYLWDAEGIILGDSLIDPAPVSQLGSAVIANFSNGLSTKVMREDRGAFPGRGNGYNNIHRLIPTVEGQLIFMPMAAVGAAFPLSGTLDSYTAGIFHHSTAGGQYIAYGTRIYRLNLTDFAALTYTLVALSESTAISVNARYTGGAFVWRDRIYFGIENGLNGQAIGYAWVDFIAASATATVVSDTVKGFSFGAANRGRLFIALNQATNTYIRLKWSSDMTRDYTDAAFVLYGDTTTAGGTFIYGIEPRPRVSWVLMMGSAALFFREDGSVLASDEAGFIGISSPRSQSSGAIDKTQGFGAVHYIDGAAFRVFAGGPHHINPVNLVTRSLSPGNAQDISIETEDPDIISMYAVGEHLLMAGASYLYDVIWRGQLPIVHKLLNLSTIAGGAYAIGSMTQQGGVLAVTMFDGTNFKQLHFEVLPSLRVSTEAYSGAAVTGWVEPGLLIGPERSAGMTKLWLQVRGTYYTRVGVGNTLTFSNGLVDAAKSVTMDTISAVGPFAAQISGSPQTNRLGRTLGFRLNMNCTSFTGFNERLYLPLVADFLWAPTLQDRLTLHIKAASEQPTRAGGVHARTSARTIADALIAKQRSVITVEFSDGTPTPAIWNMFVEDAEAVRTVESEAGYGADSYKVKLVCRRL